MFLFSAKSLYRKVGKSYAAYSSARDPIYVDFEMVIHTYQTQMEDDCAFLEEAIEFWLEGFPFSRSMHEGWLGSGSKRSHV